ncbi:MAG: LacI family DNA-binding transcriptional regulator [Candidatus Atribacteria bacterium]|nr:LacI family DNA-binding transcriptional regulator [Candidatus Atribacteria bacterium]
MAKLKEIAEKANVSVATVSHVINGTRPVSDTLCKRVLEAMKELGAEVNISPPKNEPSHLIAMVIDDIFNPFFTEVFAAAESTARTIGYHLLLLPIEKDPDTFYLQDLGDRKVDGFILATRLSLSHLKKFLSTQIPLVFLGGVLDSPFSRCILFPDEEGAYLATRHLVELGHYRILCVGGSSKSSLFNDRFEGYKRALREKQIPIDPQLMVEITPTFEEAYKLGLKYLSAPENQISAVFAQNDPTACGIMVAAQELGRKIPEDLSVVGFDNTFFTQLTCPSLTSIEIPKKLIGKRSIELLVRLMHGNEVQSYVIEEVKLVERKSTTFFQKNNVGGVKIE